MLNLEGNRITDTGLKELKGLKGLREIGLGWTGITDAGLEELNAFPDLEHLTLGDTKVTDNGLKTLEGLSKLEWLDLQQDKAITDAGMTTLARMKNLKFLVLHLTSVTDAGVRELHTLKNLKFLGLLGTNVSEDTLKELKATLPGIESFGGRPKAKPPAEKKDAPASPDVLRDLAIPSLAGAFQGHGVGLGVVLAEVRPVEVVRHAFDLVPEGDPLAAVELGEVEEPVGQLLGGGLVETWRAAGAPRTGPAPRGPACSSDRYVPNPDRSLVTAGTPRPRTPAACSPTARSSCGKMPRWHPRTNWS